MFFLTRNTKNNFKLFHSMRSKPNKSIYVNEKEEIISPEVYEILKYGYPESRCKKIFLKK